MRTPGRPTRWPHRQRYRRDREPRGNWPARLLAISTREIDKYLWVRSRRYRQKSKVAEWLGARFSIRSGSSLCQPSDAGTLRFPESCAHRCLFLRAYPYIADSVAPLSRAAVVHPPRRTDLHSSPLAAWKPPVQPVWRPALQFADWLLINSGLGAGPYRNCSRSGGLQVAWEQTVASGSRAVGT